MRFAFASLVVGSLLISGFCQAALPLAGTAFRSDFARCRDAVVRARIEPDRVVLLDESVSRRANLYQFFFYVYEVSGGPRGTIVEGRFDPGVHLEPALLRSGTVLLGSSAWGPRFTEREDLLELVRSDSLVAVYVR
jgi:hypothetical protein